LASRFLDLTRLFDTGINRVRKDAVTAHSKARIWIISSVLFCFTFCLYSQDKKTPSPLFKVQVDTVYVKVSVADPLNRYVTGLEKENFKVYEDNVEQQVTYFSQQSAPISVGVIFDISGSMGYGSNIRIGKNWLVHFLQSSLEIRNPLDEYSLITFNTAINLVKAFSDSTGDVQSEIALQKPGGWTALFDAVYRGLDHLKQARNEKKALVVISDGEDNHSRYTFADVRELSKECDVQIYGIGLSGPEGYGHSTIRDLVGLSGGRVFFSGLGDLGYYFDLIHAELRSQYLLGYIPSNLARNGQWRQIKIKLDVPKGLPKLSIKAKDGYYAPKL
jgi:Ca-activated chloride channel family protein